MGHAECGKVVGIKSGRIDQAGGPDPFTIGGNEIRAGGLLDADNPIVEGKLCAARFRLVLERLHEGLRIDDGDAWYGDSAAGVKMRFASP